MLLTVGRGLLNPLFYEESSYIAYLSPPRDCATSNALFYLI